MRSFLFTLSPFLLSLLLSGCATTGSSDPKDPWEGLNRKTYAFNDVLDRALMKPLATTYEKIIPGFAREGVNNFFDNLEDINTSIQNILQGKPKQGFSDAGRFVVNSVFGIFGLWDVATPLGLEKHYEDFGQTLGVWGVGPGPYLVLPFFGASSLRDAPAKVVDPSWYYGKYIENDRVFWSIWSLEKIRTRANLLKAESIVRDAALDEYSFIRDAWWQRRQSQVYDGSPPRVKEEE